MREGGGGGLMNCTQKFLSNINALSQGSKIDRSFDISTHSISTTSYSIAAHSGTVVLWHSGSLVRTPGVSVRVPTAVFSRQSRCVSWSFACQRTGAGVLAGPRLQLLLPVALAPLRRGIDGALHGLELLRAVHQRAHDPVPCAPRRPSAATIMIVQIPKESQSMAVNGSGSQWQSTESMAVNGSVE